MSIVSYDYTPHPGQRALHECPARFRVCAMGRRWGKTTACVHELFQRAIITVGVYWWIAPTYRLARKGWDLFHTEIPKEVVLTQSKSEHCIELVNGSRLYFLSADRPEMLVGEGVSGLIVDEAARVKREAWEYSLRPTLTDTRGWALFASTPLGRNWFHHLFQRGEDSDQPSYASFRFPTTDNPYIDPAEVGSARRELPLQVFRQEYIADFVDEVTGVFRGVSDCVMGDLDSVVGARHNAHLQGKYTMGVDLARHSDYTVIAVLDDSSHLVYFDRFTKVEWPLQKARIVEVAGRYNAEVLLDATGVGDPILDDLRHLIKVVPFHFTNERKKRLIWHLMMGIEERNLTFPDIQELVRELELFTYEITPAGNIRYGAPEGFTDDCVIALALAYWQATHHFTRRYHRAVSHPSSLRRGWVPLQVDKQLSRDLTAAAL